MRQLFFSSSNCVKPVLALVALLNFACTESPPPKIQELIKVRTPTIGGLYDRSFTSASHSFTLNGECDTVSRALQYSLDGNTWTEFAPSCPAGTFTLNLVLTQGLTNIYVRANGKFTPTSAAIARVRFTPAPSAPLLTFATSSRADNSDLVGYGTQNAIGDFATGFPMATGNIQMSTYVPGVIYSEQ